VRGNFQSWLGVTLCLVCFSLICCSRETPAVFAPVEVPVSPPPPSAYGPPVSYSREVAPVLEISCAECHNPDSLASGLDVTSHAALLRGGKRGPAVIPWSSKKSLLVRAITSRNIDFPMMPPGEGSLPYDVIMRIKRWIDQGAANN